MATACTKTLSLEDLLAFAQENREKVFDVCDPCGCLASTLTGQTMEGHYRFYNAWEGDDKYQRVHPAFGDLTVALPYTNSSDEAFAKNYTGGQLAYGIQLLIDGVSGHDAADRVVAYASQTAPVSDGSCAASG